MSCLRNILLLHNFFIYTSVIETSAGKLTGYGVMVGLHEQARRGCNMLDV